MFVKPRRQHRPVRQGFHGLEPLREPPLFPLGRLPFRLLLAPPFRPLLPVEIGQLSDQ
jgi:hypothetical protein